MTTDTQPATDHLLPFPAPRHEDRLPVRKSPRPSQKRSTGRTRSSSRGPTPPIPRISIPVPAQGLGRLVRPARSLTGGRRCRLAGHLHKGEGRGHRHRRPPPQAGKAQQPERGAGGDLQGIRGRRTSRRHQTSEGARGSQVSQVQNGARGHRGEAGRGADRGEHGGHSRHRAPPAKGARWNGDRRSGRAAGGWSISLSSRS